MKRTALMICVALLAASCSSGATPQAALTATPYPTHTVAATYTPYPTYTVPPTAVPSATPVPPTTTPEPAAFERWTTAQTIAALQASGCEVGQTSIMAKNDYGMAPAVAKEGVRFLIPSLCADCGGRVFAFASQADLDKTRSYYVNMGKASKTLFSWTFARDNILIQLNGDLPEAQARRYEAALAAMK